MGIEHLVGTLIGGAFGAAVGLAVLAAFVLLQWPIPVPSQAARALAGRWAATGAVLGGCAGLLCWPAVQRAMASARDRAAAYILSAGGGGVTGAGTAGFGVCALQHPGANTHVPAAVLGSVLGIVVGLAAAATYERWLHRRCPTDKQP